MENQKISFYIFINVKTWFQYARRPHFSELSNFGNLNVIESPLVIFSGKFLKNIFKSVYFYLKYSRGINKDSRSNANLLRPLLLFPGPIRNKIHFFGKIDYFLLQFQLKKLQPENEDNLRIYILTAINQNWVIRKNENIYYALDMNDEWSMIGYNEAIRPAIEAETRKLISKVDFVSTVTKKLQNKYNMDNKIFYLPNAVDISHYVPIFDSKTTKKIEQALNFDRDFLKLRKSDPRKYINSLEVFRKIKRPAVGAISGLSGDWSDFDFMSRVEELLPEKFSMVSTGNIFSPTRQDFIPGYKKYIVNHRMLFLEHLDYSILPDFLSNIDVGIVMHRMDEFNKHSAPNKIWAYLAMGLPVVSTNFLDEMDKEVFEGMVYFADTPGEYVEYIVKAFEEDNQYLKEMRRSLAIKNSTYNRAYRLFNLFQEKFNQNICVE